MMNTMRRVTLVALLVAVASASSIAQANAQFNNRDRNDRNDRIDNVRDQVQDYLDEVYRDADRFTANLDRDLDQSRLNNRKTEDEINRLAQDIRRYARNAKNKFDRQQQARDDVRQLVDSIDRMDSFLRRTRISLSRETQRSWSDLRSDTDRLRNVADRIDRNSNSRNGWWR